RAAPFPALPGRTWLRADVPAVARPAARHDQPDHDRRHRQIRPRPSAIRAQDDQLKVAEKTSIETQWVADQGEEAGQERGSLEAARFGSPGPPSAVVLAQGPCGTPRERTGR